MAPQSPVKGASPTPWVGKGFQVLFCLLAARAAPPGYLNSLCDSLCYMYINILFNLINKNYISCLYLTGIRYSILKSNGLYKAYFNNCLTYPLHLTQNVIVRGHFTIIIALQSVHSVVCVEDKACAILPSLCNTCHVLCLAAYGCGHSRCKRSHSVYCHKSKYTVFQTAIKICVNLY